MRTTNPRGPEAQIQTHVINQRSSTTYGFSRAHAGSTMAGLSVLLETTTTTSAAAAAQQQLQYGPRRTTPPQIVSKAAVASPPGPSARSPRMAPPRATCSFLHRCFLCRRELADGVDIYIYRGDRAFCSEECRCRHILLEDDDGAIDCARVAAADRSSRRRRQAGAGGFEF